MEGGVVQVHIEKGNRVTAYQGNNGRQKWKHGVTIFGYLVQGNIWESIRDEVIKGKRR